MNPGALLFRCTVLLLGLVAPALRAEFVPAPVPASLGAPAGSIFGHVTVPVHHAAFNDGTIRVAVLILKARAALPAPDPVLFFVGGPGTAATGFSGIPVFATLAELRMSC